MKTNYLTREFLSMFPESAKKICTEFCEVMEYEIDINQFTPMIKGKEKTSFGFSLYPSEHSRNKGVLSSPISERFFDMDSLVKSLLTTIDELLERLGETRTSMRMKAQLKGIAQ